MQSVQFCMQRPSQSEGMRVTEHDFLTEVQTVPQQYTISPLRQYNASSCSHGMAAVVALCLIPLIGLSARSPGMKRQEQHLLEPMQGFRKCAQHQGVPLGMAEHSKLPGGHHNRHTMHILVSPGLHSVQWLFN